MGRRIDFENAIKGRDADNFTCQLFRLMLKSDGENLEKFRASWPVEVKMVEAWRARSYGLDEDVIVGPDSYGDESLEGSAWIHRPDEPGTRWLEEKT